MRFILPILLLVAASLSAQSPSPEARTALVIGVSSYADRYFNKLEAPEADAQAMAAKLKALGFDVTLKLNATRKEMLESTDAFGATLAQKQGVGLFYFSGHGSIKADEPDPNFLIPSGTSISSREDLPQEAFNAQRVANRMKEAGNRLNLIFLDACRNNALPSRTKDATGGLAAMRGASGLMFFFATQPNQVALEDSVNRRSLFTAALLKHIESPGLSFMDMMSDVTAETEKLSMEDGGDFKQSPFMSGTLSGRFAFVPQGSKPTLAAVETARPAMSQEEKTAAMQRIVDVLNPKEKAVAAGSPIVIGEVDSMTGVLASFGNASHQGMTLAINEINAAGGLLGRPVRLVTEDDQSRMGNAGIAVRKLISTDRVVAVLGQVASGRSLEMAPICQSAGIPMISPASTNPKVTGVGDFIFRVCFIDPYQGTVMGKFALSRGWKRVAILTDKKQDYTTSLSQVFKEYFGDHGGAIISEQTFASGDKDFTAQLNAIRSGKPDAIFVSGYYNESALIAVQARRLGITVPLLGGDGWDSPSLVETAGAAIEGCYFSNHFSPEAVDPNAQKFVKKFEAEYKAPPDAMAALGYDAVMVLADAIKRAKTTEGSLLRDAIAKTEKFDGVTGRITLDASRNAIKPGVILTIRNGQFKFVETVTP